MKQRFEYEVLTECYQFHLQDEDTEEFPDWTRAAGERLLAVAPGIIGVGTVRDVIVPVVVEITDGEPDEDIGAWDQANECTIDLPSGRIVVAGCADDVADAARIEVLPGAYRARVYYGNLGSRSKDGRSGNDYYEVVLWSAVPGPLLVLKQARERYPIYSAIGRD